MSIRSLFAAATFCIGLLAMQGSALANPALQGTWNATIDGQRLVVTFDGKGGGSADGRTIRYQSQGTMLLVEDRGEVAMYQFQLQGDKLFVAGGQLPGLVTFSRGMGDAGTPQAGSTAPRPQQGYAAPDLVGKWCKASSFTANAGGGSQSSACFELRADGSYVYGSERSMSAYGGGGYGATSGSSNDAGRWTATASSITAHSRSGQVSTYQLERRNHPKNRDPMLCLDGECYVTYWRRAPW